MTISIIGNQNFQNQASINGWVGDGSISKPYSISNLNITNSSTIDPLLIITDTNLHFNITDCYLDGGLYGIFLNNVTNGLVYNNSIQNSAGTGVLFYNSHDLDLYDNNITTSATQGVYFNNVNSSIMYYNRIWNNLDTGILCDFNKDVIIWNNSVYNNNKEGILIREGEENTIEGNYVYSNGFVGSSSGMKIGNSDDNNITENFIFGNKYYGIDIQASDNNTILKNAIYQNQQAGISIGDKTNVSQNTFYENSGKGVLTWGTGCNISENNFIDNNLASSPSNQAEDFGLNNYYNNFWSGWIVPDENEDGYVDIPYSSTGLTDDYPLTSVIVNNLLHLLLSPQITYPTNEEYVQGNVNITWAAASDTYGHSINYSLFYSINNGSSWILIEDSIQSTNYMWDSSVIESNQYSLIKVEAECSNGLPGSDRSDETFKILNIPHTLSYPIITYPLNNSIVNGTILIEWEPAIDSWFNPVVYNLYIINGSTGTLVTIANDIEDVNYLWDSESFSDGEVKLLISARSGGLEINITTGIFTIDNEPDIEPEPKIPGYSVELITGTILMSIFALIFLFSRNQHQR